MSVDVPAPRTTARARIPRQRTGGFQPAHTVLVAVGTDKHRFDRLIDWLDDWYAGTLTRPTMVIQYGHSRQPAIPGSVPFLSHAELQNGMAAATLVVCHGGPATILEARRHGHLPIVVPRDPSHLEHVDNHQQLFARRLGAAGMIELCESRAALAAALNAGLARPRAFTVTANADVQTARLAAVARVGRIVEELVATARPRRAAFRRQRRPALPGAE
ncbi:UDP-N-acetylglucosamine transferase subunit ALG13 [Micromonospora pattaloongensis]|uniref:UDP-N-acetylglucosamine transferase subunit ALG13 n=1 Tax=Micromonospora pattaloongensis TaxID=405436 RepID=A0A1H3LNS8_9ACTN|nr:glycosyltransferase [Micromonospora pattaloongensis]SDY66023.1 UDP-N-acetylglucosamine transferase subunit ALG13 [Micromonospora pattaloongensis]